jgi:precorrin-4 methylase
VGLTDIGRTAALLRKYWPPEAPVAIAYRAGYRDAQQVVRTTLGELENTVSKNQERHLGIIYIGKNI